MDPHMQFEQFGPSDTHAEPRAGNSVPRGPADPEESSLSLPARVRAALQKSSPDWRPAQNPERWYMPSDAVDRIIQPDAVRQHLAQNKISSPGITTQDIVDYICGAPGSVSAGVGARKLFCILLIFARREPQYTRCILDFYREPPGRGGALTDQDLPLRSQSDREDYMLFRGGNGASLSCFAPGGFWEASQLRAFDEYQWWMLAPVFDSEQHASLSDRTVFPWSICAKPITGNGGSEVRKIKINENHHTFDSPGNGNLFALKILKDQDDFDGEVSALRKIRESSTNQHLASLLTTFQHGVDHCLLFHWADGGSLKDLWNSHDPDLAADKTWTFWAAEQCHGLAKGLKSIHYAKMSMDEIQLLLTARGDGAPRPSDASPSGPAPPGDERDFGRHGDIKPSNILWFQNEANRWGHGVLKITDFGLTTFHREHTTKVLRELIRGTTLTYEAPEYRSIGYVSRPYDIWSLGCVYLELATWAIKGVSGVQCFRVARMAEKDYRDNLSLDVFFALSKNEHETKASVAEARVKKSVLKMMDDLKSDSQCAAYFQRLIDYIRARMLVIDPHQRATSRHVEDALRKMYEEI